MLVSFLSHIITAWFAFLLPSYSTFKALSSAEVTLNKDLIRWSKYWCIVSLLVAVEYAAESILSWLPFYYEIKTIFLLFLALPQTEGSTYIFNNFVQPTFTQHQADIDAGIIAVQSNTFAFLQGRIVALWQIIWGLLNKNATATTDVPAGSQPASTAPPLNFQTAMGLWNTYGGTVMNALQPKPAAAPAAASTTSFQAASSAPELEHRTSQQPPSVATPNGTPPFPEVTHFS